MAPRPEQKLQPQMQPAALTGGPRTPQPIGPKQSTPGSFGGNRFAKGVAFAILPIALLGYAAIASGLVSFPGAKPNIAHSIAATSSISSTVTADQGERGDALARIGIETHNLTRDLAKRMALQTSRPDGMVVTKVFPNTAGERGGLLTGDIILAVDGIPVGQGSGFTSKIEFHAGRPERDPYPRTWRHDAGVADKGRTATLLLRRFGSVVRRRPRHEMIMPGSA